MDFINLLGYSMYMGPGLVITVDPLIAKTTNKLESHIGTYLTAMIIMESYLIGQHHKTLLSNPRDLNRV